MNWICQPSWTCWKPTLKPLVVISVWRHSFCGVSCHFRQIVTLKLLQKQTWPRLLKEFWRILTDFEMFGYRCILFGFMWVSIVVSKSLCLFGFLVQKRLFIFQNISVRLFLGEIFQYIIFIIFYAQYSFFFFCVCFAYVALNCMCSSMLLIWSAIVLKLVSLPVILTCPSFKTV